MKREMRPFIVEVRRGSKKQAAPFMPAPPETQQDERAPLKRAEELLFSKDSVPKQSAARTGRILEPVHPQPVEPVEPVEPAQEPPRRRGRPPGSKNRSAEEPDKERGARGRPRIGPEVRSVKLTPEIVNAAIETISKLAPGAVSLDEGSTPEAAFGAEQNSPRSRPAEAAALGSASARRGRGRPRRSAEQPVFVGSEALEQVADERSVAPQQQRNATSLSGPASEDDAPRGLRRSDMLRLFKPGERWKGRIRLRALARRRRQGRS